MSVMASESAQMGITVAGVMANILKKGLELSFITLRTVHHIVQSYNS